MGYWKPVTEWKRTFAVFPVFTSDGKYVWLKHYYIRRLKSYGGGGGWCYQKGSVEWVESETWPPNK